VQVAEAVRISHTELIQGGGKVVQAISEAFGSGPSCLGIIIITNIEGYPEKRKRLLPLASRFGNLPEEVKDKYVHKESTYSTGWSHGKEKFQGKFDTAKGSYYANPIYDHPTDDPELIKKYPDYCSPNIWPKQELPDLEFAFKDLGHLIVDVGALVAKYCDIYCSSIVPGFPEHFLEDIVTKTRANKARLLHYFPQKEEDISEEARKTQQDSWCGWHFDHCALTGLTSAMYLDPELKEVPCPDPTAGLYIRTRGGEVVKVSIPGDALAFQMGEVTQVASGGKLRATSHCVRAAYGPKAVGISRDTLAVFMQPMWSHKMICPEGMGTKEINVVGWTSPEQNFAEFTTEKFREYYEIMRV
jgi:isopenicillin N synthase-like dioxygenase